MREMKGGGCFLKTKVCTNTYLMAAITIDHVPITGRIISVGIYVSMLLYFLHFSHMHIII